ncbi:MAG TPA: helicase-related protein [Solirubrobacterales bacterium]|nr:helicase-related protein [Solirubrobacterales bacterium]
MELSAVDLLSARHAVRDELCEALQEELIGPRSADEVLKEPPLNRYLTGILYPHLGAGSPLADETDANVDVADDDGENFADPAVAMSNVQYPSSVGLTFAVDPEAEEISVAVQAAGYEAVGAGWQRQPIGPVEVVVPVAAEGAETVAVARGLELYCRVRETRDGARPVTLVLLNNQRGRAGQKDAVSFFQVGFEVRGVDREAPFVARPEQVGVDDEDLLTNALLYRDRPEFAIGHGCAAEWEQIAGARRARTISATFMPVENIPLMESNPEIDIDDLGLDLLAQMQTHELGAALDRFVSEYATWITRRETEAQGLDKRFREVASAHLAECAEARRRIEAGVALLRDDERSRRAFRLANRAMADQMERTSTRPRESFRWRPFQLAFMLLSLPSIVDGDHPERSLAELLWFPTGGGKTEAYLGLFAFTVFHRRLAKGGAGGVTAIMRYTLRLLTTQQFERAARVVCACERIRKQEGGLGEEPISIGLFVGAASTPNTLKDAAESLAKLAANHSVPEKNPCQLQACPWCNQRLLPRHHKVRENPKRLQIGCGNSACDFAEGLPVFVVDEDLYRHRPTLVIGTVDKFAALPWNPDVGNLFNLSEPSEPPPELVIQDELHLISGPLGTMTGLYETAVDLLCSDEGAVPKVIASTATIRRARAQSQGLFARKMRQFPPPGLDPDDNWFATSAPADRVGARRYVGLMAAGVSHATLMIRTYAALMHRIWLRREAGDPEAALDPYWTLIGYFNSLRVLGAARMQVQDDVQEWLETAAGEAPARRLRDPAELTSRVDSADIPNRLKDLEAELEEGYALDVVLATNMISVGVDVDRLGLMVVMGQPQAAAEYIQATSRVGRRHPGLVVTLLNSARSRDRSHYEGFAGFHSALYRSVEATSVTPFSPRARDRGLHAVLIAMARLRIEELRKNEDAGAVGAHRPEIGALCKSILARTRKVEPEQEAGTAEDLAYVVESWLAMAEAHPDLVYRSRKGTETPLLISAAPDQESGESFPTMWSLRDVDAESNLFFARRR